MSTPRRFIGVFALRWVAACGDDESEPQMPQTFGEACALVPGCETAVVAITGAPEPIWCVVVVRDGDGAIRIESVEEIDVATLAVVEPDGTVVSSR